MFIATLNFEESITYGENITDFEVSLFSSQESLYKKLTINLKIMLICVDKNILSLNI